MWTLILLSGFGLLLYFAGFNAHSQFLHTIIFLLQILWLVYWFGFIQELTRVKHSCRFACLRMSSIAFAHKQQLDRMLVSAQSPCGCGCLSSGSDSAGQCSPAAWAALSSGHPCGPFPWRSLSSLLLSYTYPRSTVRSSIIEGKFSSVVSQCFFCSLCSIFLQERQSWVRGIASVSLTRLIFFCSSPLCFSICGGFSLSCPHVTVCLLLLLMRFFFVSGFPVLCTLFSGLC